MGFPLVGVAAYVIFEMQPTWGRLDCRSLMWNCTGATNRIRVREEQFEELPSINNCLALAAELHAHQQCVCYKLGF